MNAYVEVIRADGSSERHRIEGEQTTVGRSPAAGISLPGVEGLEPEHLLIAPRVEGCWVAVAKGAPRAKVGGADFDQGICLWGTEISVGSIRLKILDTAPQDEAGKEKKTSPVVFLALAILPILLWSILESEDESLPQAARPPELLTAVNACPSTGVGAESVASEKAELADAKSERYAFEAQDGVQAVTLYAVASRCYAAVGNSELSTRMERRRAALAAQINSDYRNHQLRLQRALQYERWPDALAATNSLQALTHHLDNDYTRYLSNLSRRLQSIISAGTPQ